jgi:hypothetical protein
MKGGELVGKKISLLGVALVVLVLVLMVFAGSAFASYNTGTHTADHSAVAGSVHDVSTPDDPNPCEGCHIPHGANPNAGFLWANPLPADTGNTTGGVTVNDDAGISTEIKPLCYSCHDGTTTALGVARVFSATHTNHRTRAASALRTSGSSAGQPYGPGRDCDLCHDPHDDGNHNFRVVNADGSISTTQNWTGASSFLKYERRGGTAPNYTYTTIYPGGDFCGSCHSGNMADSATAKTHPLDVVPGSNGALSKAPVDGVWLPESGDYSGTRLYDVATHKQVNTGGAVKCESCHTAHGAEPTATYTSTNSSGVTSIIHSLNTMVLDPSAPGANFLCVNCH